MYRVTGLRKATLKFEEFVAANWEEAKRFIEEETASFFNLQVRRVRFAR